LTPFASSPGDINGDEAIDVLDLYHFAYYWQEHGGRGDLNRDGVVDRKDLFIFMRIKNYFPL